MVTQRNGQAKSRGQVWFGSVWFGLCGDKEIKNEARSLNFYYHVD